MATSRHGSAEHARLRREFAQTDAVHRRGQKPEHDRPIYEKTGPRATRTGENWASLEPLQALAERVFAGEEVTVPTRERSAFNVAVSATLDEVDYALNPRRVWLKDSVSTFDAEYADLFPGEDRAAAAEAQVRYRRHRVQERSPTLRRLKIDATLADGGPLQCEACGFDFADRYGELGRRFIERHHRLPLAEGEERETTVHDSRCYAQTPHRMIHRTSPLATIEDSGRRFDSA